MSHHHHSKKNIGMKILLNLAITIAEFVGGSLSGSLALISDAGHNLADVISLILGFFLGKITEIEPTKKHSFGFKRAEIFTAIINALVLWGISVGIIIEAFRRINSSQDISIGIMQGVPDDIDFEAVYKSIEGLEGVKSAHHLHI